MEFSDLLGFTMIGVFIGLFLYVLFGQVTVRRLRKDPATKDFLGVSFVSGWDILNVAQALSLPRFITAKLSESPVSFLHARRDILLAHTSKLDRFLAKLFYYTFMTTGIILITLVWLNVFGYFD